MMKDSLYDYMNLGINHHLLNFKCFEEHNYHLETLPFVLNHPAFQIVDLFIFDDEGLREKEIELIKNSQKEIIYNGAIMLPSTEYNPHSPMRAEREEIFQSLRRQADLAIKVNASKFVVVSNLDPGKERREQAKEGFAEFLYDFASYVSDNSEMKVVLEPVDRDEDKKLLAGPVDDSVEIVKRARGEGAKNLGLMVDLSHLPLLREPFDYVIEKTGNLLWHVHIGNCIIRNKKDKWYGDKHPPIGFPKSEIGVDELANFLQLLLKYNYLKKGGGNSVTIEVRSFPDRTAQETVSQQLQLLEEAWIQHDGFL